MQAIGGGWDAALKEALQAPSFHRLCAFLEEEYAKETVFPARENLFAALKQTPLSEVKAVILGQDPYHEPGQAHGLAFSVLPPCPMPPSLKNICRELIAEGEMERLPEDGLLTGWAQQGVLLLNTVLTVRAHAANSHSNQGWEPLTDAILQAVDRQEKPVCFLLWGGNAAKKQALLHNPTHLCLTAPHPSPLSAYRGFFGCGHFKQANDYLSRMGETPIDWSQTHIRPTE